MADCFENGDFDPDLAFSPSFRKTLGSREEHWERIQNQLRKFLCEQEARETAAQVYDLALDIDEDIRRILKDPLARKLYTYDGLFFTPRVGPGFHTSFGSLYLLNWLTDSVLESFFRGRDKHSAIRWMLDELGKHAWVAKRRRLNWEESHNLRLVPKDVLEALIAAARERRAEEATVPPPLSREEQVFFQSLEEQMNDTAFLSAIITDIPLSDGISGS